MEEIDNAKIQEWIECDHDEKGYQNIIDEDYLNNQTSAESSDKSSDDDENNVIIKTSHREAGDAVNVLIHYFEEQPETDDIHLLQLRKMKEIIRDRIYEAQKQKKITDFFVSDFINVFSYYCSYTLYYVSILKLLFFVTCMYHVSFILLICICVNKLLKK